jgi:branched-chain amino acid transport system permease protein
MTQIQVNSFLGGILGGFSTFYGPIIGAFIIPIITAIVGWIGSKNPLAQFGLLAVALILILIMSETKIIPVSTSEAIGSVLIYAIAAIGFCLLLGYSGLASLGTASFIGVGTFLTGHSLRMGTTIIPAILIAGIVAIVLGVVVGFISLRIEGIYLAILTLCLSEALAKLLKALSTGALRVTAGEVNFFGLAVPKEGVFVMMVIFLLGLLVITANLINSPTGRAMQAMKSSTSAAQAMGISLMKYRLFAFVVATLFASIAGSFYMIYIRNIEFSQTALTSLATSLNILGAVIIGGAKSLWGTLFGTFIVFGFQQIVLVEIPFFQDNPAISVLFTGALMIVICMFFPGGFAEIVLRIRIAIMTAINKRRIRKYGLEA